MDTIYFKINYNNIQNFIKYAKLHYNVSCCDDVELNLYNILQNDSNLLYRYSIYIHFFTFNYIIFSINNFNYNIPNECRLILKLDASDKSCYARSSEPESEPDLEDMNDYNKKRFIESTQFRNFTHEEFEFEKHNDRLKLTILKSFLNVYNLQLNQLRFNIIPPIIKECTNLNALSITIKGRPNQNTWNALKNHPSLKTLVVFISSKKKYFQHLDNLIQIIKDSNIKLFIIHKYSCPSIDEIQQHLQGFNFNFKITTSLFY